MFSEADEDLSVYDKRVHVKMYEVNDLCDLVSRRKKNMSNIIENVKWSAHTFFQFPFPSEDDALPQYLGKQARAKLDKRLQEIQEYEKRVRNFEDPSMNNPSIRMTQNLFQYDTRQPWSDTNGVIPTQSYSRSFAHAAEISLRNKGELEDVKNDLDALSGGCYGRTKTSKRELLC